MRLLRHHIIHMRLFAVIGGRRYMPQELEHTLQQPRCILSSTGACIPLIYAFGRRKEPFRHTPGSPDIGGGEKLAPGIVEYLPE